MQKPLRRTKGSYKDIQKNIQNSIKEKKSEGGKAAPRTSARSRRLLTRPAFIPKVQETAKTSWGNEAEWYTEHLEAGDTYHAKVILPNLLRIVAPEPSQKILEIGCGEGFFSRAFALAGADVLASDISPELIAVAKEKGGKLTYKVSPAEKLNWVPPHSRDTAVAVLTLQNMEHIEPVFRGVSETLTPGGRFVIVINHPMFRIPKATSWGYDEATLTQYRRVDGYLSARRESIDMHPGQKGKRSVTYSYHRSLQDYMKALKNAGFVLTRLEEWVSHRTSEAGPRARAENTSRKEFPLFMLLEATKIE